jgi:K+ transporter
VPFLPLVLAFQKSENLANAYGAAVSLDVQPVALVGNPARPAGFPS